MRSLRRVVLITLVLAAATATGCSSSSSVGASDSGFDSQPTHHPDARVDAKTEKDSGHAKDTGPVKDTGSDVALTTPDAGVDGPCNFAAFVLGMIKNDTTATALPSTNLGASCTDDMNQSEFSTLFM